VITYISSGGKHTALLTDEGLVYICGTDVLGLLGMENKKWKEQHKFQVLSALDTEDIIQIACAEFHSLCLSKEGFVYAWGGNLGSVNL
jgi:alpha-tubulin suppressor-like RCC1 family protein